MSEAPPSYKLYAPWIAGFAAFLGGGLAGGMVLAVNYWRLGRRENAVQSVIIGLGVSMLVLSLALFASSSKFRDLGPFLTFGQGLGIAYLAENLQGQTFQKHIEDGGSQPSLWWIPFISLLSCAIAMGVALFCWLARAVWLFFF